MDPQQKEGRLVELDGIRGLAAVCVAMSHMFPEQVSWMRLFVDTFFVLSAFLITRILLVNDLTAPGVLRNFYARRSIRIWPVYYLAFGFSYLVGWWPWGIFYKKELLQTSVFMQFTQQYFHDGAIDWSHFPPWFSHSWSMAAEEQFYVFWPLMVFALRGRLKTIAFVACMMGVYSWILRDWIAHSAEILLLTRFFGFSFGILLAVMSIGLLHKKPRLRGVNVELICKIGFPAMLLTTIAYFSLYLIIYYEFEVAKVILSLLPGKALYFAAESLYFSFMSFALIGTSIFCAGSKWLAPLRHKVMQWLGSVSYALYMFHFPVFGAIAWFTSHQDIDQQTLGIKIMSWAALLALVWCSKRWIEEPIGKLRRHFPQEVKKSHLPL